ncbi:hypothetical protein ACKWMY_15045 [Serratia sp. J2]|uniref:hypothetical protein n=1 Tax=Serratia sp. J2 TaxID=3386551 RepID=UPI003916CFF4
MLTKSVNPILVEQYADMHAVDFRRRRLLLESYEHDLDNLYQWDMRLLNYMRGLELLSDYAESYLQEQLLSPLSVGDVFTIALFSVRTKNNLLLEGCLTLTQAIPHLIPAIKSLVEWAPIESILWQQLNNYPYFKALAVYLRPEVSQLSPLTENDITYLYDKAETASLLIYALFYQKHPDAHDITNALLATENVSIKMAIVDVVLRHHLPVNIKKEEVLFPLMYSSTSDVAFKATRLFTLYTHYSAAEYQTVVTPDKIDRRIYIQALGWSGYTSNIPLLIEYLDGSEYARLSAASMTTITGSLPIKCGWNEKNVERFIAPVAVSSVSPDDDPDISLTWPDKSAFLHWWQQNAGRFDTNGTYLDGVPAHNDGLSSVLRYGSLILRRLAAERLQYQQSPLTLNTDAPAFSQITQRV